MSIVNNCIIIGLTGQSGSGKSTVSSYCADNGFYIIDADKLSREVANNKHFLNEVINKFPDCVTDGKLDRPQTAALIFSNPEALDDYTSIIYPYISQLVFDRMYDATQKEYKYLLLDAPTLFESGLDDICDAIVSVTADYDVLVDRIVKRDGISKEVAKLRLSSQKASQWYALKSDYVIENNSSQDELMISAINVIKKIKERFDA